MMPHQTIFGQTGKKSKEKAQINVFDKMLMKTIFLLSLSLHIYVSSTTRQLVCQRQP